MKVSHFPLRATTGAFVLNSGLSKRSMQGESIEGMHGMAAQAIPQVRDIPPPRFAKLLSNAEVALGGALLMPAIPSALVGAGLAAFGAGLVRLYWKTPGMHQPKDPRPTQQGVGLAKDVWLLGAGLTLLLDDILLRRRGANLRRRGANMRRCRRRNNGLLSRINSGSSGRSRLRLRE